MKSLLFNVGIYGRRRRRWDGLLCISMRVLFPPISSSIYWSFQSSPLINYSVLHQGIWFEQPKRKPLSHSFRKNIIFVEQHTKTTCTCNLLISAAFTWCPSRYILDITWHSLIWMKLRLETRYSEITLPWRADTTFLKQHSSFFFFFFFFFVHIYSGSPSITILHYQLQLH